jgi:hypothetical protein
MAVQRKRTIPLYDDGPGFGGHQVRCSDFCPLSEELLPRIRDGRHACS